MEEILELVRQADRVPVVGRIPRPLYARLRELCKKHKLRWADVITLGCLEVCKILETEADRKNSE